MKRAIDNSEHLRQVTGSLIMNADDWGRDRQTTDRALDCVRRGSVTSVSAMVFMEDSERAAITAREFGVDSGLHLNLTTPFSGRGCSSMLRECQEKIARYLLRHRLAQVMFHPGLTCEFEHVVKAQIDEFGRLYGRSPTRLDGHHHMHLCANVLSQGLLPLGAIVRRNFSFAVGEKSVWNRLYRRWIDRRLAKRHRLTDYFFSLEPVEPVSRLQRIFSLAHKWVVEVEAHPVKPDEYRFLMEEAILRLGSDVKVVSVGALSWNRAHA
ncbi:MAG: ChbG/HpnK family deacetylase [Nitrospira sp.]|nr:ChbG/HpnK family deacetylase [Nitrospira sp.]